MKSVNKTKPATFLGSCLPLTAVRVTKAVKNPRNVASHTEKYLKNKTKTKEGKGELHKRECKIKIEIPNEKHSDFRKRRRKKIEPNL